MQPFFDLTGFWVVSEESLVLQVLKKNIFLLFYVFFFEM